MGNNEMFFSSQGMGNWSMPEDHCFYFVFNFLAVSDHSVVKQIAGNSETNCACVKLELAK